MIARTTGLEDDEQFARGVIADSLIERKEDPLLIKALLNPGAEPPKVTLEHARKLYEQDKGMTRDRQAMLE